MWFWLHRPLDNPQQTLALLSELFYRLTSNYRGRLGEDFLRAGANTQADTQFSTK